MCPHPRGGFNHPYYTRKSTGVMERWSNGVMIIQVEIRASAFFNTPILQYSSTPKTLAIFTDQALQLWPGPRDCPSYPSAIKHNLKNLVPGQFNMLKCSHLYVCEDSRQSQPDKIISVHPKTLLCHSEPFVILRINSAKDLEILRRPAFSGTPQNDNRKEGFPDGHWSTVLCILS